MSYTALGFVMTLFYAVSALLQPVAGFVDRFAAAACCSAALR
jgi:hypothetical protein